MVRDVHNAAFLAKLLRRDCLIDQIVLHNQNVQCVGTLRGSHDGIGIRRMRPTVLRIDVITTLQRFTVVMFFAAVVTFFAAAIPDRVHDAGPWQFCTISTCMVLSGYAASWHVESKGATFSGLRLDSDAAAA